MAIQTATIDMAQAWVDRAEARLRRFAFFNKADRLVEAASMFECAATEFARTNRGASACIAWRRAADLYEQGAIHPKLRSVRVLWRSVTSTTGCP
jgi:hypothetical protein